jgi:hypothetical protein
MAMIEKLPSPLLSARVEALFDHMIRVLILTLALAGFAAQAADPVLKIFLLDNGVTCVRPTSVTDTLTGQLQTELTNQLSGLVLDLRFTGGAKNFTGANFLPAEKMPVIVLVNSQTRGAAADWAAQLRMESRAILIGGADVTGKIAPDITLTVTSEQEKKFQEDPFAATETNAIGSATQDLLPFIDHTSEAELVRRRVKDGDDSAADAPRSTAAQPVIRDPALARALDLFKALAVLKLARG